jgi:hypothetical protein
MKVSPPSHTVKFFTDEVNALKWLQAQKKAKRSLSPF